MRLGRIVICLAITAIVVNVGAAPALAFSKNEILLQHGPGFEGGSKSPNTNSQTTLTLEHFSAHNLGDLFYFVDVARESDGDRDSSIYAEIYPSLSITKLVNNGKADTVDFGLVLGLNQGEDLRRELFGAKVDLHFAAIPLLGFYLFNMSTVEDPVDRDLDDTVLFTLVWIVDLGAVLGLDEWQFSGFADFAGAQGSGVEETIITQWRIRRSFAETWVAGVELGYRKNKFGREGLDEFTPQLQIGWVY